MRLIFLILLICLVIAPVASAQDEPTRLYQKTAPKVAGRLVGFDPTADEGLKLSFVCVVPLPQQQVEHVVHPDADGRFEFRLPAPLRYQQIWFQIGDYYYGQLIVDQGLVITVDLPKIKQKSETWLSKNVEFSGFDGTLTQYVNQYTAFKNENRKPGQTASEIMMNRTQSAAEKEQRLREVFAKQEALEQDFVKKHPSSHAWVLANERQSELYGSIFIVYMGKEMPADVMTEALQHQPKLISNESMLSFYKYMGYYLNSQTEAERLAVYRQRLLPSIEDPEEKKRLMGFIELYEKKLADEPYDTALFKKELVHFYKPYRKIHSLARIDDFLRKAARLPQVHSSFVKMVSGPEDIWARDQYMKRVLPTIETKWCVDLLQQNWEQAREKIRMTNERLRAIKITEIDSPVGKPLGELPNGAELYVSEQEDLETLLGAIRNVCADKAVILDIWATWCSPCIRDMKESEDNLMKLRKMDVEVIYLCTADGTTQEDWKKKVAELELPTRHLYLSKELSDRIMSFFDLNGYPSHVLLDKQGKYHPEVVRSIRDVDFDLLKEKLGSERAAVEAAGAGRDN